MLSFCAVLVALLAKTFLFAEETEMYGPVGAKFFEMWMGGEIVLLPVFENQDAVLFQQRKSEVGKFFESVEGVGGIGEDEVEASACRNDEAKYIAADEQVIGAGDGQFIGYFLDELLLRTSHLDAGDVLCPSAEEFERDAACPAEEVEADEPFEIHSVLKDVEESLLGQIGGRAGFQVAGSVETTAAVYAGDNFHCFVTGFSFVVVRTRVCLI